MSAFRVSSYADEDIESIFRYTVKKWGVDQADSYFELLATARDSIAANPFLPGSSDRGDLAAGCRTFRCGKHVFFSRIHNNTVEIARILHQAMDFEKHVSEENFP
ncbi:MAG: type II toxin-antitoxin system RelE/ParE family toxin [Akkermansiaceae bacterium]